jgi:thiamine kinase-like enzyme
MLEHPAVQRWNQLSSERIVPKSIELLELSTKSTLYRIEGVGPKGTNVIAKRSHYSTAAIEREVYEGILPYIPLQTPLYFGIQEEPGGEYFWLFIEDVGSEEFSENMEELSTVVAQWMAILHTSSTHVAATADLPDRGPNHYFKRLQSVRCSILARLSNPSLDIEDAKSLAKFVWQCNTLESHWHEIENFCERLPKTLVHGDLAPENVRVRCANTRIELLVFDWEKAGWCVPAVDLAWLEGTNYYYHAVRDFWPHVCIEEVEQLSNYGAIFRILGRISLAKQSIRKLSRYQSRIAKKMRAAGLGDMSLRKQM